MSFGFVPSRPGARSAARAASAADGQAASTTGRPHQSAAPVFSAIAVAAMVVASITFGRSAGLVAPLWGGGGLAVVLWLRTARGPMYDYSFCALLAVGMAVGNLL